MSTLVERDRRWAVVGDDAGYLRPGPSPPRGAGVFALLGILVIAVASATAPATQASVSLAGANEVSTSETDSTDAPAQSCPGGDEVLWPERNPGPAGKCRNLPDQLASPALSSASEP